MSIAIDKGIPLAPRGNGGGKGSRPPKYPWRAMAVGDSFLVPDQTARRFSPQIAQAQRLTGFKFASRAVEGGLRVWRTA